MKGFLLDENLPRKIRFVPSLPVKHTDGLGTSLPDSEIWEWAGRGEFVIVTKDADFSFRILQTNPPPWVVHLRIGNLSRNAFHDFLAGVWPEIERLLPAHKLINVYADRIEAIR